ncbi:MAG: glycosyltransferase family 2 protein [Oscillospiraceae bacterium]|nr:glycosyltransferase family 2 protein [Oscillospiraceae bacterium]
MAVTFSVIVPLYNEQEVIHECYTRLKEALAQVKGGYELIFVNDGSRDDTWPMACRLAEGDKDLRLIGFSRNFGHQTAITAGMDAARGKAVVVIDADLQDPPRVILDMIEKWREGYHVVYGRRVKRKGETLFKKATAKMFYRTLNRLTDVNIPNDVGDFRLIDRAVCDVLKTLPERNRYVRGLISWIGFRQTAVDYVREERFAGETKYPLKKMFRFAADALTSFSYKPLKLSTLFGSIISAGSFIYLIVLFIRFLMGDGAFVQGWMTLAGLILFLNGILMIMLGIQGQYIGRIYDETKGRPIYVIGQRVNFDEEE